MSKNFIDMSFDEIFPEQKAPPYQEKNNNTTVEFSENDLHHIEYNDYNSADRYHSQTDSMPPSAAVPQNPEDTDPSRYFTAVPPPQPTIPDFTDFNPEAYQYNNMNPDNSNTALPKVRDIVRNNQPAAAYHPPYNNFSSSSPVTEEAGTGIRLVVLGCLGLFFLTFPPVGILTSLAGMYHVIKYNIKLTKSSPAAPKTPLIRVGLFLCIFSLILNILLILALIIP